MKKTARIFVAGHRGLVGSALVRQLQAQGFHNLLLSTRDELDLTDQAATSAFFVENRPDYVLLAAAKVGGILANNTYPADFIRDNLAIEQNVITSAHAAGVTRLLFLGSSCIYPRDCPQPIEESSLLTGTLEPTNRSYALAKIAGIELCWAFNRQYGTRYLAVMPTNLYGPGDNYDSYNSHVLPALIRKMHEAKQYEQEEAVVWGTGTPRREFLYSDDLASACLHILQQTDSQLAPLFNDNAPPLINIGCGEDISIADLAQLIADVVGFAGRLSFDHSKPDGTPQKVLNVTKINNYGWSATTTLKDGIALAYRDFLRSNSLGRIQ
ncbi:GDP-L-fucose synthase family protein [Candidatus Methylobacter oryzae]|uniref:GDP-L-fucose synthase n=1 Tax=Candidatus Methylobacter oryzae TaxID=2497749 RepID=A0ABY3CEX0_9GAMM|nr:GDP-L-fucose synthase [Candidatus Methylobacter oryzae]TRX01789.1 GDP-L-fucose synthase [Candidatus Methylobacter oryzae]